MAAKNNIRSMRFSDEMTALIDQQIGDTFTQKFESLVTRCVWELPEKKKELKQLEARIIKKRQDMMELTRQMERMKSTVDILQTSLTSLQAIMDRELKKWDT